MSTPDLTLRAAPRAELADDPAAPLRDRLDRCQSELVRVRRQLVQLEAAHAASAAELTRLQAESAGTARLYVACLALHGTLQRAVVLDAAQDLLINLAATEEFGLYLLSGGTHRPGDAGVLELVRGFGIDAAAGSVLAPDGVVAGALAGGRPTLSAHAFDGREPGGGRGEPVGCLPLVVDGRTAGAAVVWSFLPQKPGPEPGDAELYALLSAHLAVALHATS